MRQRLTGIGLGLLLLNAVPAKANHTAVEVVLDRTSIPAGGSATLALVYKIEPGWHTYWMNPGDAGAAPKVKWSLPAGITVSDLRFPIPQRKTSDGLTTFVYENEVALLATVTVAADQKSDFDLTGKLKTVVCSDECVLEEQDVAIRIPIGDGQLKDEARFAKWTSVLPTNPTPLRTLPATVNTDGKGGTLHIPVPPGKTVVDVLPPKSRLFKFSRPQTPAEPRSELTLEFSVLSELPAQWSGTGLLILRDTTGHTSAEEIVFTFAKP